MFRVALLVVVPLLTLGACGAGEDDRAQAVGSGGEILWAGFDDTDLVRAASSGSYSGSDGALLPVLAYDLPDEFEFVIDLATLEVRDFGDAPFSTGTEWGVMDEGRTFVRALRDGENVIGVVFIHDGDLLVGHDPDGDGAFDAVFIESPEFDEQPTRYAIEGSGEPCTARGLVDTPPWSSVLFEEWSCDT